MNIFAPPAPSGVPLGTPFYVLHYVRAVHDSCERDNDRYSVFLDSDGNGRIFKFGIRTRNEAEVKMLSPFVEHHKKTKNLRLFFPPTMFECPCFIKMRNRWNGGGTVVESLVWHGCPSCGGNPVVVWEDKDSERRDDIGRITERRDDIGRTPLAPYIAKHKLSVARERFEKAQKDLSVAREGFEKAQKELELASAHLVMVAENCSKIA